MSFIDAHRANAMAESFVGTLKTELVQGSVLATRFEAEIAVVEYLGWFNHTRLHAALGDLPPAPVAQFGGCPSCASCVRVGAARTHLDSVMMGDVDAVRHDP